MTEHTCWTAVGGDRPGGLVPFRPALSLEASKTVPMPSGREARHLSFGAAYLVSVPGTMTPDLVLSVPVEARFAEEGIQAAVSSMPWCLSILSSAPMESVQCRVTEHLPSGTRGRLRRMSFLIDRYDLVSRFRWPWSTRPHPSCLHHSNVSHLGFPATIRVLRIRPRTPFSFHA